MEAKVLALCGADLVAVLWLRRRKLPPGSRGWPLIGESLDYVRDPLGFLEKLKMHGGTCRANLLFSNVVILGVSEANARFILSKKDLGWPPHFLKVVGESSLPMVNDPMHKRICTVPFRISNSTLICQCLKNSLRSIWRIGVQGLRKMRSYTPS